MPISDADLIANANITDAPVEEPNTDVKPIAEFLEDEQATDEATETEGVEEVAAADESADTDPEEDTPESDEPQTFTLKVDGEDKTITLDELLKGYGTNTAANKKFSDAAHARKQAEEFINQLKTNPWGVLSNPELGLNPRELAEGYLANQLQYEQLTDEQKELQAAKQQLHQFEEERRAQEQQIHEQQMVELTEKYNQEYTTRINDALETANLPNTEASIRRLAGYMSEALASDDPKIHNLSDSDLCELVKEDYQNDFKMMFSETDADTLQKFLGDDVALKLRQSDISKVATKLPTRTEKPVKGNKNVTKKPAPAIGMDDFHNYLDSL